MISSTNQLGYEVQVFRFRDGWVASSLNDPDKCYTKEEAQANLDFAVNNCALSSSGFEYRVYPKLK